MFKDVHEVIFSSCVVNWQACLGQVLKLLHVVIVICNIPSERVSQGLQKPRIRVLPDKTRSIWVEPCPDISEMLAQMCVHEFVLPVSREFESLQNDCDEEAKENG